MDIDYFYLTMNLSRFVILAVLIAACMKIVGVF